MTMRRPTLVVGVVALALSAAVAAAQSGPPPITVRVFPTVTPNKAGTPRHPQGVKLGVRLVITYPAAYQPPLVDSIDVWFPRGGVYNGSRYPSCSYQRLNALGPAGCPPDSIMGTGGGVAAADTNLTYPRITIVNGGQHKVFAYTILNNPARVQTPVVGTIIKLRGRWSYKLHVVIPKILQVVAGVPIVLHSLHLAGGRGDWLATTFCPANHLWPYQAMTHFDNGQVLSTVGTVRCR